MNNFDSEGEHLIELIISICNYARLGYQISVLDNCNNCHSKNCQYKPPLGGNVVWNCPFWDDGK